MSKKPAMKPGMDTEMKFVSMKIVGGEAPSNAVLSSKLSPFGCNPKKAGEEISKNTKEYTNIHIYVKLSIQSREIKKVDIFPTCSAYIIKELKELDNFIPEQENEVCYCFTRNYVSLFYYNTETDKCSIIRQVPIQSKQLFNKVKEDYK